jgi:feruloyl-CoA synthase
MSQDFGKLRKIVEFTRPRMIYAREGELYAKAIKSLTIEDEEIVVSEGTIPGLTARDFGALPQVQTTDAVARAFDHVSPDDVAKILFTSGSTGEPKGVVTTHRMLSVNQQSIAQCWPFLEQRPPVILDWLPWSHAFGANHNFNIVLRHGGSLYIDGGRPAPGLIERTVANLRESLADYLLQCAAWLRHAPALSGKRRIARRVFLSQPRSHLLRGGVAAAEPGGPA